MCMSRGEKDMNNRILGISIPRDIDAILLGAGVMFVAYMIPSVGEKLDSVTTTIRVKLGGKAVA